MSTKQPSAKPISLMWFRNDLRATDNTALWNAAQKGSVVGLFIITAEQWRRHDMAEIKIDFIRRNLIELQKHLAELNIPLLIKSCPDYASTPKAVVDVASMIDASTVFWNREYLINEQDRDKACRTSLASKSIDCESFEDSLIAPPGQVINGSGEMYKVFTPFYRNWAEQVRSFPPELLPKPAKQEPLEFQSDSIEAAFDQGSNSDGLFPDIWTAGELSAKTRLDSFLQERVGEYDTHRDIPCYSGTSSLSPYLSSGVISARQSLLAANSAESSESWIRQLAWRDFYNHLVSAYPDLVRGKPFQAKTEKIQWRDNDEDFKAWTDGLTGQPLVDAGMRQLKKCGWMHNRLRMVTAMFLTKNLFIDWHRGERHFLQHLVDGDFALNNGGWQWSASTGTDAAPYFRIFNPFSQSKRFDPEGEYIREYLPELRHLPSSVLHSAEKLEANRPENYPSLIVDLKSSREQAIKTFSSI